MKHFMPPLALCALALGLISCAPKPKQVILGVAINQDNHPGVRLAVEQINSQGGIRGIPMVAMGLDWRGGDPFEPLEIHRWAQRFADTKDLVAVIGHSDSSSTLSAAAYYNQKQIPQIVTLATNPAITNIGDWTYRLCLSDARQGPALAEYAVNEWGKKRIAVFYVNDDYGRGLTQLFEKRVQALGGEIVASTMHRNVLSHEDKDLIHSVLLKLKQRGSPQIIALFQRMGAAIWTLQAIRDAGIQCEILGGDSLAMAPLFKSEPQLTEGIRVSLFFNPRAEGARTRQFVRDFRQFANQEPDNGNAFAYDAVLLVADAVRNEGSSRDGVKRYLDRLIRQKSLITGAAGPYTLGRDHDVRRSLFIGQGHGGTIEFLKELPMH